MAAAGSASFRSRPWALALAIVVLALLALVLAVAFFPWDTLRGPLGRYVSHKTGRHVEITQRLDVQLGRTTRVRMEGVRFGNPDWAEDRDLIRADAAEVDVRLLPLLLGRRIELPLVRLTRPQLGLQAEADGRKTWALGGDTQDEHNVPEIGALVVDQGTVHYVARHQGADVRAEFAMDQHPAQAGAAALPLRFKAQGRWQEQAFSAEGRTGDVLYLSAPLQRPFPAEVSAKAGATSLQARGAVASLATLDGSDVDFRLQGENLAHLYHLVGVVLPDTPHYALAGHLSKRGELWRMEGIEGRLGHSDIAGEMAYEKVGPRPYLTGTLKSRVLDFEDLAPLIGGKEGPQREAGARQVAAAERADKRPRDPHRKVLPDAALDVSRLKTMNADVRVDAARVVNAKRLPLDRMGAQVTLKDGLLVLDPLDLGVAGGRMTGRMRIDANAAPVAVQATLDARALALQRLLPRLRSLRDSSGELQARIELNGRGASVAQVLATANGNIAVLMGKGQLSNIALEVAGLDGGQIFKFFLQGDKRVQVQCAALAFDVERGKMASRAFLLDTDNTVFHGDATVDLAREQMDILVRPEPKAHSLLSLRSPLHVGGTFGAPQVAIEKGPLARRAVAALALSTINPLLALGATSETGPGHDADCAGVLRDAAAPGAVAKVPTQRMGAAQAVRKDLSRPNAAGRPATPKVPAGGTPAQPVAP